MVTEIFFRETHLEYEQGKGEKCRRLKDRKGHVIVQEDLKVETITTAKMRRNRLIKRRENLKLFEKKNVWRNINDISYEDSSKTTKLICQKESALNTAATPIKHKFRKISILTFAL